MAAGLVAATLAARWVPPLAIDWQPALAWQQPWRWWSAAFVHYSPSHLAGNLLATALVGAYGWAAQLPSRAAVAWLAAWPLMHLALLGQPELQHYGGLSGLMHAGVAVANVHLVWGGNRAQRLIGGLGSALLVAKVVGETPWRSAIQHSPDWDIPIAPVAHLSGLVAGLVCGVLGEWTWRHLRARRQRAG
jgi:rhomboid family GlyGly-CTERM serine protease